MSRGAHEIHLRCLRVGLCCYTLFIMLFMLMFILLFMLFMLFMQLARLTLDYP